MTPPNGHRPVTWRQLVPTLLGFAVTATIGGIRLYSRLERVEWQLSQHVAQSYHSAGPASVQRLDADLAALREEVGRLEERVRALEERRGKP